MRRRQLYSFTFVIKEDFYVTMHVCMYAIQKHPWGKKSKAKSEALKDVISGRGQGLLGFNHFVYTAIYNHVQTNRNNACRQTIET